MTLLHADNCGDTYAVADLGYRGWAGGPGTVTVVAGRVSGSALRLIAGTIITPDVLTKNVALGTEFTRHFGLYMEVTPGSDHILMDFSEAGTNHIQVCITSTRLVRIKRNGTTVVTGTHAIALNTWTQVVIHLKIGDAATGQCHVWLDTVADISDTTSDFKNGLTGAIDTFNIRGANGLPFRFDDIHDWSGNDNKGNTRVLGRLAASDGNYAEWDPLTGTDHTAMVDDPTPDGDTTYNWSDTTAQRDSFVMQPLGLPSTATIYAYGITAVTRKLDIGARVLNLFHRFSGADQHGSDFNPSFDYAAQQYWWETNPGTAAPWTVANVDATEAGYRDHT
jgi:hypothetical protein